MPFLRLDPCDGPDCPRCGCRDTEILQEPPPPEEKSWFAAGIAVCRHCRRRFNFREVAADPAPEPAPPAPQAAPESTSPLPKAVTYPVAACPECGSPRVTVTSSGRKPPPGRPRIRRHECAACGESFKSTDSRHLSPETPRP